MLKIELNIHDLSLKTALQELLPQAGICIKENEKDADCLLFTPPFEEKDRPALNFLSFSRPLRLLDLLSHLEALPYSRDITFSHFSLDIREKILKNLKTKENQRLTEKESQLIRFFHQNKGLELSKEMLLQEIWAYHPDVETHTLETHIYRLRQKVEEDPNNPQIVLNRDEGYVLE